MGEGNSVPEKETTQVEIKPSDLRTELREIFNPDFSTLGHGTRLEAARKIAEDGLRAKFPDLSSTTIPLFDRSKRYDEQADKVVETVLRWPHRNLNAVVVLMIPNPPENSQIGGWRYFNSVFEETGEPDTGENARYVVPPRYIKGYVDVEGRKFVSNPLFSPETPKVKAPSQPVPRVRETKSPPATPPSGQSKPTGEIW